MTRNAILLTDAPLRTGRSSKAKKAVNRGRLLRMLESECVIMRLVIDARARLVIEHQNWEEYWLPVKQIGQGDQLLDSLKDVWSAYIRGNFPAELRMKYCYSYFRLLDTILKWRLAQPESKLIAVALCRVLGFECFGISPVGTDSVSAAGTCTARNPTYLLTKLRNPDVLDSGEHLPLISTAGSAAERLFYHYRQHRLSHDSDSVILTYLDVNHATRSQSFRTIALLERALAEGTDPFAPERAARMARSGILDYLSAWSATRGNSSDVNIDIVDLGAGSGLVAARLCAEIVKYLTRMGSAPRFRIGLIDLSLSHPARFFASGKIAKFIDSIEVMTTDYRKWLDQGSTLPKCDGVRLVLISRFFNNLSDFAIHSFEQDPASELAGHPMVPRAAGCQPTYCLAPDGSGPEQLIASNARVWLETGRTFKQASLSPYFLGLRLAAAFSSKKLYPQVLNECVYFPVRTFRPNCLLTKKGGSVLGTLARQASIVVVQDADMTAADLKAHYRATYLEDLLVLNTTRNAGLRGHFSYLIAKRSDPLVRGLPGERIW